MYSTCIGINCTLYSNIHTHWTHFAVNLKLKSELNFIWENENRNKKQKQNKNKTKNEKDNYFTLSSVFIQIQFALDPGKMLLLASFFLASSYGFTFHSVQFNSIQDRAIINCLPIQNDVFVFFSSLSRSIIVEYFKTHIFSLVWSQ